MSASQYPPASGGPPEAAALADAATRAAAAADANFALLSLRIQQARSVLAAANGVAPLPEASPEKLDAAGHLISLAWELVGGAQQLLFELAQSGHVPLKALGGEP